MERTRELQEDEWGGQVRLTFFEGPPWLAIEYPHFGNMRPFACHHMLRINSRHEARILYKTTVQEGAAMVRDESGWSIEYIGQCTLNVTDVVFVRRDRTQDGTPCLHVLDMYSHRQEAAPPPPSSWPWYMDNPFEHLPRISKLTPNEHEDREQSKLVEYSR